MLILLIFYAMGSVKTLEVMLREYAYQRGAIYWSDILVSIAVSLIWPAALITLSMTKVIKKANDIRQLRKGE